MMKLWFDDYDLMDSIIKVVICLLLAIISVGAVTSITHRRQLVTCLNTCHQEVTRCINLRHDKCLKSYHTCLQKAKDKYRCFNSSQIKQLKELTRCIEQRCEEVEEEVVNYEENPLRTEHRLIQFCRPWIKGGKQIVNGFLLASQKQYKFCELVLCKVIQFAGKKSNLKGLRPQKEDQLFRVKNSRKVRTSKGSKMLKEGWERVLGGVQQQK